MLQNAESEYTPTAEEFKPAQEWDAWLASCSMYGRVGVAERNTPCGIVREGGALRFPARTLQ